ncbi:MAG: GntR family transcriptional regulator, partial [Planctomycetota bacterium]|nr:GntR family transcriptional regulator [Planctomycetota bacterium]
MAGRGPASNPNIDVYAALRRRIDRGEFAPGSRLPSLRALAQQYGQRVSRVHRAVQRLEIEDRVRSRQGSGVFVNAAAAGVRRVLLLNPVTGDTWADYTRELTRALGDDPQIRLLVQSIGSDDRGGSPAALRADPIANQSADLRAKVRAMVDEGIDVILFNGLDQFGLSFITEYEGRVPLICFYIDHLLDGVAGGRVVSDWHHGGYSGMKHLIELGCRRILLTRPIDKASGIVGSYLAGARAAAKESLHRVEVVPFLASVMDPLADVFARFAALSKSGPRIDGVFAHSDWLAARLMADLARRGVRVPGDVPVLGYHDTPWTRMTDPPLSSVSTDPRGVAAEVRRLLDERRLTDHVVVKPKLMIRGSTVSGAGAG